MKVGFFGALTIVLLVLKLTAVPDMSWWWVASPLITVFILYIIFFIIAVLVKD